MSTHYGHNVHEIQGGKDYVSKVGPALRQLEQSLGGHIVMFGMGTSSLYRMIKLQMWAYEQGRDWEYILFKDHETVGGSKTLSTLGYDHCTDRDICVFIDDLIDRGRTFKKALSRLREEEFHFYDYAPERYVTNTWKKAIVGISVQGSVVNLWEDKYYQMDREMWRVAQREGVDFVLCEYSARLLDPGLENITSGQFECYTGTEGFGVWWL